MAHPRTYLLLGLLLLSLGVAAARAEAEEAQPEAAGPRSISRSGYSAVRVSGGPESVSSTLRRHDQAKESYFRFHVLERATQPWYRWKKRLKTRHGLAIGTDYNLLYQGASAGLGETEAGGGVFRLYTHWTVLGRGTPNTGEFVFRIENRHNVRTPISPEKLGGEIGSLYKTANSFADFDWGITNLQWQQWWRDGRYGIALGQVDLRDWVDTFDLSNWRTALLSAAVTYPVNPLPSAGLGGAAFAYFRECSTPYVIAGFSDANGHADKWGGETFFKDREFYSFLEAGWTPRFKDRNDKNLRLTYWHQDARIKAGVPGGWGLSFSGAWKFKNRLAPFLRGGYAHGGVIPARAAVVGGIGYHRRSHDLVGAALGWAEPWESGLRNQVTFETFYRIQLSQNIGITPDFQMIWNPSRNPGESWIGVLGFRFQIVL